MALALVVNGSVQEVGLAEGASLTVVIAAMGLKGDRVAVERNGEIVPRSRWDAESLRSGDKLEIVHFVGGGSGARGAAA